MGSWKDLKNRHFTPEQQAEIRAEAQRELALAEVRAARRLSQEEIAKILGIKQASVSKMERQADMYVSSLRNFIRAMGGEMKILAVFPEGEVVISQFADLGEEADTSQGA